MMTAMKRKKPNFACRASACILLLAVCATALAEQDDRMPMARKIMDLSGIERVIDGFPAQIETMLKQYLDAAERLSDARKATMLDSVRTRIDPAVIRSGIARDLEAGMTRSDMELTLAFLSSPVGRRMVAAEQAFDPEKPPFAPSGTDPERLRRLLRIDEMRRDSEWVALIAGRVAEMTVQSLLAGDRTGKIDETELRRRMIVPQDRLLSVIRERMVQMHALVYAALDDADLTVLQSFVESEAGRRYHDALFSSFDRLIGSVVDELSKP